MYESKTIFRSDPFKRARFDFGLTEVEGIAKCSAGYSTCRGADHNTGWFSDDNACRSPAYDASWNPRLHPCWCDTPPDDNHNTEPDNDDNAESNDNYTAWSISAGKPCRTDRDGGRHYRYYGAL